MLDSRHHRTLCSLAVCLSGAAGLIYQVAWTRQLITMTSATIAAQATVLSVFMAGLGLGSLLAARFVARVKHPLLGYALCEVLAVPLAIGAMPLARGSAAWIPWLAATGGSTAAHGWQLALLSAYMLLPVTLLGMSLPLVIEHLERQRRIDATPRRGVTMGLLYGFNTLGAAAGALIAGYVLLERFGLLRSVAIGGAAAVASAVVAVVLSRNAGHRARAPSLGCDARYELPETRLIAAAALAGGVGLAAEVVWTRLVALVVLNTVYAFAQVLAAVLLGVAIGGYLAAWIARRSAAGDRSAVLRRLALVQACGAVFVSAVPWVLVQVAGSDEMFGAMARGSSWKASLLILAMLIPPAALSATVLPLIAACSRMQSGAGSFGVLYAANTVGSVAGSLLAGFVILPALGTEAGVGLVALAGVGVGALLLVDVPRRKAAASILVGAAAVSIAAWWVADIPMDIYARRLPAGTRVLALREGASSDVMVTEDENGWRRLWINSVWVAGTGGRHRLLGHLPGLFVERPERGLGIALGTGQTFGTILEHGLVHLDCVEIDGGVIALSTRWFGEANGGLFDRANVTLHQEDGRTFLRRPGPRYDVIVLEPLQAWTAGTSSLYTVEFYQEARGRLAPGGVVAQWIPFYGQSLRETRAMVRAGLEVFPHASLWLDLHDGILLLHEEPLRIDPAELWRRVQDRGLQNELAKDHAVGMQDVMSLFLAGSAGLRAWVQGAPLLDDDHPFLEFAAARHLGRSSFAAILDALAPHMEPGERYAAGGEGLGDPVWSRAERVRRALLGAAMLPANDERRAGVLEEGLAGAPGSGLLSYRYRATILGWASELERRGAKSVAVEGVYLRGIRNDPGFAEAGVNLAVHYAQAGRFDDARRAAEPYEGVPRTRAAVEALLRKIDEAERR